MKVKVNKNKCLGCGLCTNLCPQVFELKNGRSQIKKSANLEKNLKEIKQAAENCPVQALKISD